MDETKNDSAGAPEQPDGLPAQRPAANDLPPGAREVIAEAAEDEEDSLPAPEEEAGEVAPGTLAAGRDVILGQARLAPPGPGVYRMMNAGGDVLYVGKAKSLRKRLMSYTRPTGHVARIERMIAATAALELISTRTDSEALLLEANLIKQLRPRFNVLLRDDKSFPSILLAADHWAPQILKHRGARARPGKYFGPFASASAVNRTLNALQRAFLLRSCSDGFFEGRTRACLLHQIKRCSAPCVGAISHAGYDRLVREATDFLSGRSRAVKEELAREMEKAADTLDFETAAVFRDRLAALSAVQSQQGINPAGVENADVFAIHQQGGMNCIEVFFFRTGQNWGNRAYYPRADRSLEAAEVLGSFLAQFYDDKPCPPLILLSDTVEDQALLAEALALRNGARVEVATPQRGEKRALVEHALANAREALGRKLAETSTQQRMMRGLQDVLGLARTPARIEVYDNSHIQGSNAVGGMVVAGPEGFEKGQYRKFNIRSEDLTPGDDYGMMREVLRRRFRRLAETPAPAPTPEAEAGEPAAETADAPLRPDIVMIDGGLGQLHVAQDVLAEFGVTDVALVAVAKGEDRDAGRETLFQPGREAVRLGQRDPVLYFIQRLRDEAHRFAIGSHRQRRKKDIREAGLQEIEGIGPTRKRALLRHFGTLKQIESASVADLSAVPGISAESARRIYDYFHASA